MKRYGAASPVVYAQGGLGGFTALPPSGSTPEGPGPLIEVVGLGKDFGGTRVLEDVDFRVQNGEKVCIVGPSGSG